MTALAEPAAVLEASLPRQNFGWWRALVAGYAIAVGAFLVNLKWDLFDSLTASRVLQIYSVIVAGYLLSRMALGLSYRPSRAWVADARLPVVAAVVPAFNERERIVATIDSIYELDYPRDRLRVIVVDDGSSDDTWDRIVDCVARHPALTALRFATNRGKRAAMAAGIRAASDTDLVLFVDSDSTLERDALRELVRPFVAPDGGRVAVVTGHADVLNASANLLTRLQQVRYYAAFRIVKAAESRFGTVSCASGCFSAYRTTALLEVLPTWETQRFLGREATFGDDRALTNYLLERRWRSVYQSTAVCGTAAPETWRGFLRQQLRWKKSWARESLRVVRIAWRWHPFAAAAMYASIALQLVGPFVAFHSLVWAPIGAGRDPLQYLVGLYGIAVLYGLYYAWSRRSPHWWGGIMFAFVYSGVLCWQTYWAIIRSTDTGWGTRATMHAPTGPLVLAATAGPVVDCGIPLGVGAVRERLEARSARRPSTAPLPPITRHDWRVGLLAVPLTAAPMLVWLLFG